MRLAHLVFAVVAVAPISVARAHFHLDSPASIGVQDATGNPQKTPPCGNPYVPTNVVTDVLTGSMISITIDETIFHPGHYYVALAATEAELPPAPPVTPVGADQCGSVEIDGDPMLPLLADGLLPHDTSFGGAPQTFQVQLPAGMECPNCVLQVVEYMRNHGAPCFYYHCARVNVTNNPMPMVDAAPGTPDASGNPATDAGDGGGATGGGCSSSTDPSGSVLVAVGLGLIVLRRRRR
jgi:MYXO-CTERM domain-containing protein